MDFMDYRNDTGWVRPYLGPGESILWQGRPQRFTPFTLYDAYLIPFSLLWCGFAVFWEGLVIKNGVSLFSLFGIPFVLMGLYFVFGRFIYRWYLLKHTTYVITTQKILRRRNKKVEMVQGYSMPPMQVKEHRDGLKSILFGQSSFFQTSGVNRRSSFGEPGFALEFLSDGERALRAINSIRSSYIQQQ